MENYPFLISVPPAELDASRLPSSLFPATSLLEMSISDPLRRAVQVLIHELSPQSEAVLCLARPEMFVEATTLGWLNQRVNGATQHICLTDGSSLKALPGFQNQLFFYGGDWLSARANLRKTLYRAPEQLSQYVATINDLGEGGIDYEKFALQRRIMRPSVERKSGGIGWSFPFYRNPHSDQDSAERMLGRGVAAPPKVASGAEASIEVLLCSEASMHDVNFCRVVAEKICQTLFHPERRLIIQLPVLENGRNSNLDRMTCLLEGLRRSRVAIPRLELEGVTLVTGTEWMTADLRSTAYTLTIPSSAALWRWSAKFFAQAANITCHLGESETVDDKSVVDHLKKFTDRRVRFEPWCQEAQAHQALNRSI